MMCIGDREGGFVPMYCTRCGSKILEDAKFCEACGVKVLEDGLTRNETEELKHLQLKNERSKSTFFTIFTVIIGTVITFIGVSLMGGPVLSVIVCSIILFIGIINHTADKRRYSQKQK
jgi:hypothetical protein